MKVKMQTLSAGPLTVRRPGEIVNVGAEEAAALIRGRYATPADKDAQALADRIFKSPAAAKTDAESKTDDSPHGDGTATVTPPENAAKRTGGGPRKTGK